MGKKKYTAEQIINKLREAEVLLSQGATVGEASKKISVTEQTYYRWRREYGGMQVEQAEALEHLDFAMAEFRDMKMQPALEHALRHKDILKA